MKHNFPGKKKKLRDEQGIFSELFPRSVMQRVLLNQVSGDQLIAFVAFRIL